MRSIGEFKDEAKANALSMFLGMEGIDNQVEEDEGLWVIWVRDEECLERASRELDRFRQNPHRAEYLKAARKAEAAKAETTDHAKALLPPSKSRYQQINLGQKWRARSRIGSATLVFIGISALVYLLMSFSDKSGKDRIIELLAISNFKASTPKMLDEFFSGQIWRLVTPIFLHFTLLHFAFNMMWLFELGGMVENRKGLWFLVSFVILTALLSNLAQYFSTESYFGGMSGVVYALFGYVWLKGKFDPGDGLFVPQSTVVIMMVWFFLCITVIPGIANVAHGVGLGMGAAWGYLSAIKWRK